MSDKATIKVVCRFRPENTRELTGNYTRCVQFDTEQIQIQV